MITLGTIVDALECFAPLAWQEEYDNSGLQVGLFDESGMPLGPEAEIKGVLVCLDVTEAVIDEAAVRGCNLVVSHHPLVFRPLKNVSGVTYQQRCVAKALRLGIALYAAHTNLDNAPGGVSWEMAARLGLRDVRVLVPSGACPSASNLGLDLASSLSSESAVSASVPGSGVMGELPEAVPAEDFVRTLAAVFNAPNLRYCLPSRGGADSRPLIRTVALCGGSGGEFIPDAIAAGADCYVTGEIRYHDYFEAEGCMLVALGHYESEHYTIDLLARKLRELISQESPSSASQDQPSCASPEQGSSVLKTTLDTNPLKGL